MEASESDRRQEDGAMSSAGAQAEEVRPAIGVADSMDCRCRVRGMAVETLGFCSVVGKIQMGCGGDATMQDHRISQHEACRAENGRSLEYADV
jgi:hypothetical protein